MDNILNNVTIRMKNSNLMALNNNYKSLNINNKFQKQILKIFRIDYNFYLIYKKIET